MPESSYQEYLAGLTNDEASAAINRLVQLGTACTTIYGDTTVGDGSFVYNNEEFDIPDHVQVTQDGVLIPEGFAPVTPSQYPQLFEAIQQRHPDITVDPVSGRISDPMGLDMAVMVNHLTGEMQVVSAGMLFGDGILDIANAGAIGLRNIPGQYSAFRDIVDLSAVELNATDITLTGHSLGAFLSEEYLQERAVEDLVVTAMNSSPHGEAIREEIIGRATDLYMAAYPESNREEVEADYATRLQTGQLDVIRYITPDILTQSLDWYAEQPEGTQVSYRNFHGIGFENPGASESFIQTYFSGEGYTPELQQSLTSWVAGGIDMLSVQAQGAENPLHDPLGNVQRRADPDNVIILPIESGHSIRYMAGGLQALGEEYLQVNNALDELGNRFEVTDQDVTQSVNPMNAPGRSGGPQVYRD